MHGLVRTMVPLPSTHPSLLSDPEMLHEKFLRQFVAEQVDGLIGHRNRRMDLTNHLRRVEMDIVWWEVVVDMVFNSVFKLEPLYIMYSGENGLLQEVGPCLRDASLVARDKAIRDARKMISPVMYKVRTAYFRFPRSIRSHKRALVENWCLHDYIRDALGRNYNMVCIVSSGDIMLSASENVSINEALRVKHKDATVMAQMSSVMYFQVSDDRAVLLDERVPDPRPGVQFAAFAHPSVVAYQHQYLADTYYLEHYVPGYNPLEFDDEQVIYQRHNHTRQHTQHVQKSWEEMIAASRLLMGQLSVRAAQATHEDFKGAPDVSSFFMWVLGNRDKFEIAWERHIRSELEDLEELSDDSDEELSLFEFVETSDSELDELLEERRATGRGRA